MKEDIPIIRMQRLRRRLDTAIDNGEWSRCVKLASKIIKLIPKALDRSTCKVNSPHLDGVYTVGTSRYERSPDDARRTVSKMNRVLRTARRTIK